MDAAKQAERTVGRLVGLAGALLFFSMVAMQAIIA